MTSVSLIHPNTMARSHMSMSIIPAMNGYSRDPAMPLAMILSYHTTSKPCMFASLAIHFTALSYIIYLQP